VTGSDVGAGAGATVEGCVSDQVGSGCVLVDRTIE
jgi:hypothetical protein